MASIALNKRVVQLQLLCLRWVEDTQEFHLFCTTEGGRRTYHPSCFINDHLRKRSTRSNRLIGKVPFVDLMGRINTHMYHNRIGK